MIDGFLRLTWNFPDCSVALRFVFLTQQQQLNCQRFHQYATPMPRRLSTVPNFTSSLWMLFFVQPSSKNSVTTTEHCNLYIHRLLIKFLSSLLIVIKVGAFAWYSVKISVIVNVRFERRKVDKKQTYMKTETCNLYSRDFGIFLPNIVKIGP